MLQQEPELRNGLERAAMHADQIDSDRFMGELLASQIFMPVKDGGHGIADFHASQKAEPRSLTAEDGSDVLILFSRPERAKPFLDQLPGFEGGIPEDLRWVLQKVSGGFGIAINADSEIGIDLEPDTVTQLAQLATAEKSH